VHVESRENDPEHVYFPEVVKDQFKITKVLVFYLVTRIKVQLTRDMKSN
jgi:hypothetical protein